MFGLSKKEKLQKAAAEKILQDPKLLKYFKIDPNSIAGDDEIDAAWNSLEQVNAEKNLTLGKLRDEEKQLQAAVDRDKAALKKSEEALYRKKAELLMKSHDIDCRQRNLYVVLGKSEQSKIIDNFSQHCFKETEAMRFRFKDGIPQKKKSLYLEAFGATALEQVTDSADPSFRERLEAVMDLGHKVQIPEFKFKRRKPGELQKELMALWDALPKIEMEKVDSQPFPKSAYETERVGGNYNINR